jgi:hypothetical protein
MKQVRFQPDGADACLVDITCACGVNGLRDERTNEISFKHRVVIGGDDLRLRCDCGKVYSIHPQSNHLHISEEE